LNSPGSLPITLIIPNHENHTWESDPADIRPPMEVTRRATGSRGMATSSGSAGYQENQLGLLPNPPLVSHNVAVSGAWEDTNTYTVHFIYYETPQSTISTFKFEGNKLTWDIENKASFGPKNLPQMVGTAQ